jgi:hypothetical protein
MQTVAVTVCIYPSYTGVNADGLRLGAACAPECRQSVAEQFDRPFAVVEAEGAGVAADGQ